MERAGGWIDVFRSGLQSWRAMTAGQQLKWRRKARPVARVQSAWGSWLKFAEQMRWKNLHTGSGCRSVAKVYCKAHLGLSW